MPKSQFLIREIEPKDATDLLALGNTPGMFNFPSNPEQVKKRIQISQRAFRGEEADPASCKYVFVAEDLNQKKVVATSMIVGQHGTEDSPHFYFKIGTEKRYSSAIQTGFIHGTLTLQSQTDGPSELGALVVNSEWRSHPEKVGRQIFLSRFLYLSLHPEKFKDRIIAELLPPLDQDGHSPLWEAIGRRFTNLDYWEADRLSAKNKEFIHDLFPQGKIYTTFLDAEARSAIGKVGKDTEPVLHLLKRIGFLYQNEIDPFDGGPHLWARTNEIKPIQASKRLSLSTTGEATRAEGEDLVSGLLTSVSAQSGFRAMSATGYVRGGRFEVQDAEGLKGLCDGLALAEGDEVLFMPYYFSDQK